MNKLRLTLLGLGALVLHTAAYADHTRYDDRRWWRDCWEGERKEEFRDGPCRVKLESKHDEFKREIKCKDGRGAWWRGEWKDEFRDGRCRVKQDVKHDEFKEEVKCD
ncbi:hypothetical protein SAMN05216229_11182 [Geopseudomonas sagittaria]|uniref:Uncharacterized protein n=1 Tax=Geopseudomonas sagittaria TaxID=1135990 RepID=A0A1I5VQ21_9GAMM|nr:hypothetical protein [Pseudomonas sagittaria]SFQ09550.1 hypothetical protein SAMN05216229_11182 [Pseudomonas sagittaria]